MMNRNFVLVFDQGTTSSRAMLIDRNGDILDFQNKEFKQFYPQSGWVEHDPMEIWQSQFDVAISLLKRTNVNADSVSALGITNQRETTILWDKKTGKPLSNAIVWQDRRTSEYCDQLKHQGLSAMIQERTGLLPDAYFSGTKVKWLLENVPDALKRARNGEIAFGTIDSWLIWNLTGGRVHATDTSNASRTMLFNIHELEWDSELLKLLNIPESMLPKVKNSSGDFGETEKDLFGVSIPITGVAGDQQAALFGQMCTKVGMIKNTYGTGCFIIMNTGSKPIKSNNNLLSTIAWTINDQTVYALEGSIFIGGAVVQWLRDGLGIIKDSVQVEELAAQVDDNGDIYLVPAFTGLGAPHWDQYARGAIVGITRGTNASHIARAALESIAYQTKDVLDAMIADSDIEAAELRVDGGASANDLLMQFQSDVLGIDVLRPKYLETTALGAGYLAGLASGFWQNMDELQRLWKEGRKYHPQKASAEMQKLINKWHEAVSRSKNWHNKS